MAYLVYFFLWLPFKILMDGVMFMHLWKWFVVSTFDTTALSLAPAIGLSLVLSFVTWKTPSQAEHDDAEKRAFKDRWMHGASYTLLKWVMFIILALVVKAFL